MRISRSDTENAQDRFLFVEENQTIKQTKKNNKSNVRALNNEASQFGNKDRCVPAVHGY